MILSMRLGVLDSLLENLFRLLDKLSMKVDSVRVHAPVGIILPEDELRRLFVILVHLATVRFAFL